MINYLKAYMNKSEECSRWLLEQFSYKEILFESVTESSQREMRKICGGLLYCAMLKLYETDKAQLCAHFEKQAPNTLARFGLTLVAHMFEAKKEYPAFFHTYSSLIMRFLSLGPEAKEFMFRARMLGRCLQFMFQATPFKPLEDSNEDVLIEPVTEVPEIGLPSFAALSMFEKRKHQNTHDCKPQEQYIMEIYGILLNSITQETKTPYEAAVHGQQVPIELINDEEYQFRMLQESQTFEILSKCKKKRAIRSVANGLAHITFSKDNSFFDQLFQAIKSGIVKKEAEPMLPYLYAFEVIVSDPVDKKSSDELAKRRMANFVSLMEMLVEMIK